MLSPASLKPQLVPPHPEKKSNTSMCMNYSTKFFKKIDSSVIDGVLLLMVASLLICVSSISVALTFSPSIKPFSKRVSLTYLSLLVKPSHFSEYISFFMLSHTKSSGFLLGRKWVLSSAYSKKRRSSFFLWSAVLGSFPPFSEKISVFALMPVSSFICSFIDS